MKVFGIGLSRTGTTSLNKALDILGIKSIHGPCDPITKEEYRSGNYNLTILKQYDGITDIPVGVFFPQMDVLYPNSKFILTIRDKAKWLKSMERHYRTTRLSSWKEFIRAATYGCIGFNRERYQYVYDKHIDLVQQYFHNRDDLLTIDICANPGWASLCQFLDKPIPNKPFPNLNAGVPL